MTAPLPPGTTTLNDTQLAALRLLAAGDVTDVRKHYGTTRRTVGRGRVVVEINSQTLSALVRRGYIDDSPGGGLSPTPAGRERLREVAL